MVSLAAAACAGLGVKAGCAQAGETLEVAVEAVEAAEAAETLIRLTGLLVP